jgi:hypothetical protein
MRRGWRSSRKLRLFAKLELAPPVVRQKPEVGAGTSRSEGKVKVSASGVGSIPRADGAVPQNGLQESPSPEPAGESAEERVAQEGVGCGNRLHESVILWIQLADGCRQRAPRWTVGEERVALPTAGKNTTHVIILSTRLTMEVYANPSYP